MKILFRFGQALCLLSIVTCAALMAWGFLGHALPQLMLVAQSTSDSFEALHTNFGRLIDVNKVLVLVFIGILTIQLLRHVYNELERCIQVQFPQETSDADDGERVFNFHHHHP